MLNKYVASIFYWWKYRPALAASQTLPGKRNIEDLTLQAERMVRLKIAD